MQTLDLTLRVVLAIVLGAAIGLERQWRLRSVGIRTNALVSVGAALFVILGAVGLTAGPGADPTRVAAQVVSSIGFLGAGVILRDGATVRGITTAATLWCAAAVGCLAGAGMHVLAVVGCLAVLGTNTLLRPVSRLVNRRTQPVPTALAPTGEDFVLEVVTTEKSESRVRALVLQTVARPELRLRSVRTSAGKNLTVVVQADLQASADGGGDVLELAVQRICLDPKITSSRWWPVADDD